ncbi:MerR family transcriptional regulator [Nocardioides caeni]|uniref:MerR family transcriptional regulator n=1 Tax=Nocardioides caeni TaxID=574700 RepID=A0A4S8N0Y4_9ACTN|nr:MerR family transcriptional regulator [Nocardioides caeni]
MSLTHLSARPYREESNHNRETRRHQHREAPHRGGPVNEQQPEKVGQDTAAATAAAEEQGLLFTDDVSPLPSDLGYRGPTACNAAGITYRQLDYWARTGLIEPSVRGAKGSGSQRLYSFRDILILKIIKRLLDAGISLQNIRTAVSHLRERGTDDLTQVTLMSDGASVYECTSNDEVIDLLQGGQGVFGIAIGGVWREIEGTLAQLPSESASDEEPTETIAGDELAARRAARNVG